MSDPRFARLKTDPRFRRIKKKDSKVVVDDRFKSIFDDGKNKKGKKAAKGRVDKYGRQLTETHEKDNLRRFYRLEDEDAEEPDVPKLDIPDYARGGVLLESSDEEDNGPTPEDEDSDSGGILSLGRDSSKPIPVSDELELDLDDDTLKDLDAQAAAYSKAHPQDSEGGAGADRTRRIAVVNLDWDHVRATHLYKIFSSLLSSSATEKSKKTTVANVARGSIISVRVYPSEFGKARMAREEKEGPPAELFKKETRFGDENDPRNLYEVGDGEDYDEDALRKYQLERLRYYYAIVECDTVEAASHVYSELEGTELERSANVFDLSFVPDDMSFDDECRDEATRDLNVPYKALEFVTDALRHSKVKLTWDEDDPERNQITRRTFTRKEIEENDFKAYIASSSESEEETLSGPSKGKASRDRLRELLLGGNDDALPEGWGNGEDEGGSDVDMEVTFTPGLSTSKEDKDETTLEKYQRKAREKKKQRKEERKGRVADSHQGAKDEQPHDDFFGVDSEGEGSEDETVKSSSKGKKSSGRKSKGSIPASDPEPRHVSTAEELALVASSDNPAEEPKHFDLKAVLKAEKSKTKKRKDKKKRKTTGGDDEIQEDFAINVRDDRFKAVHEDSTFAIDPSNPHFKKTKSMSALLEEGSKRRRERFEGPTENDSLKTHTQKGSSRDQLHKLVESVKRKSSSTEKPSIGKRRKI
ncbi:hypothetical protein NLI96_g8934 [Meripilus lineatus]|uniref:NUC153 domain-containing protein n=1 Tax=Meripilus lineatus TaxID=2056292 RepID=A0AAD5UWI0_9APHY|nr:hypothetical protein NLI96_g8934 [Physisporinus lineatus]